MTIEMQNEISDKTIEVRALLDASACLFSNLFDEHFATAAAPDDFRYRYNDIGNTIFAAHRLLADACMMLDCICGEETLRTEGFRRSSAELLGYLNLKSA